MGEPLYSSTFMYKTYSLDFGNREIHNLHNSNAEDLSATKWNMLDFFGNRYTNPKLDDNDLATLTSFIEFVKYFDCPNGVLKRRSNSENLIIMTIPRVKYNVDNRTMHTNYCYYQLIKYSPWTVDTFGTIAKSNSIEKWNEFLNTASDSVIEKIRFVFY